MSVRFNEGLAFARNQSPLIQIAGGTATGLILSLALFNLCKSVLYSIGLTMLIVELVTEQGWTVTLSKTAQMEHYFEWIERAIIDNSTLGISFLAGFLIGFAFTD